MAASSLQRPGVVLGDMRAEALSLQVGWPRMVPLTPCRAALWPADVRQNVLLGWHQTDKQHSQA